MNEKRIEAVLNVLANQRNTALDNVVELTAEYELLKSECEALKLRVVELESLLGNGHPSAK